MIVPLNQMTRADPTGKRATTTQISGYAETSKIVSVASVFWKKRASLRTLAGIRLPYHCISTQFSSRLLIELAQQGTFIKRPAGP
ncbi:MAG: hypothetical protein CMJ77_15895 [Planctomycetaceae bacterium]|nr:hypothetical protein [Planctomycetaceae bacterium]